MKSYVKLALVGVLYSNIQVSHATSLKCKYARFKQGDENFLPQCIDGLKRYTAKLVKGSLNNQKNFIKAEKTAVKADEELLDAPKCNKAWTERWRQADGSCNNPKNDRTGMRSAVFRKMKPTVRNEHNPDPHVVAKEFLHPQKGKKRIIAQQYNQACAAWLQMMLHDWVVVQRDGSKPMSGYGPDAHELVVKKDKLNNRYNLNNVTHWWDSNTLYGSDLENQLRVRTMQGGKLKLSPSGNSLERDGKGAVTGFNDNLWTGLEWLHVVWIKEHNWIVEQMAKEHPDWNDEALFQHGRIVTSAAINKVHTVEWTPTLFDNPISTALQNAIFPGKKFCEDYVDDFKSKGFGRRNSIVMKGLCKVLDVMKKRRQEKTFGWTNSFVSVYRLHQLLADEIKGLGTLKEMIADMSAGTKKAEILGHKTVGELIMKSGLGVPALNNYPMDLSAKNGFRVDLPALEILRDRQMQTPRYQEWMEMMNLKVPKKFADVSPRPEIQRKLKKVYGTVDNIDLIIGFYAHFDLENIPGHVVVDPSYIMFALQTPMRTWRDKFFVANYKEEIYTKFGMDYIAKMKFADVLKRQGHKDFNKENPFRPAGQGSGCFNALNKDQCTKKHEFYKSGDLKY